MVRALSDREMLLGDPPPPVGPLVPRRGAAPVAAFSLLLLLVMGLLGWLRVSQPGLDHGDITTDANILNAGRNFDAHGFGRFYGLPVLDTYSGPGAVPDLYVTYPPGAYWLHQALKAAGLRELAHFRVAALGFSALAMVLFFRLVWKWTSTPAAGALAAGFYMLSPAFLEYADSLHYIGVGQVTLFGTLLLWARAEESAVARGRARPWLLAAGAVFCLDCLLTFEHTLFILAVVGVRAAWLRSRTLALGALALGAVPAAVLAGRMGLNAAALGGLEPVLTLMRSKLEQRTGDAASGTGLLDAARAWAPRLGWRPGPPDSQDIELGFHVLAPRVLLPAAGLLVLALSAPRAPGGPGPRRALLIGGLLLLGGLTWPVAMTEHAIVHRFTTLLVIPGLATLLAALVLAGLGGPRDGARSAPVRALGAVLGLGTLVGFGLTLRHAVAINRVVAADPLVRAGVEARARFESNLRDAGRSLGHAGVERLFMHTHDAALALKLGLPFDNDPGAVHAPLGPAEAQCLPLHTPEGRKAALAALATLGLPDMIAAPADQWLFFRPGRAGADATPIGMPSGLRIEAVRWTPSLEGRGWMVQTLVSRQAGASVPQGLAMVVTPRDGSGRALPPIRSAAGSCLRGPSGALLWAVVPDPEPRGVRSVAVAFELPGRPRRLRLSAESAASLPRGAAVAPQGRALIWSPAPWIPPSRPPSGAPAPAG